MKKAFRIKKIKGIHLFSVYILGIKYTMSMMEMKKLRDILILEIVKYD
jgi:hypothetical protein